ncbi:hypothetical protein HKK55_14465 [Pseudomonas sp. ADAK18]|uniref:hypothetical protein n=1 Tax=Pseudomonas sp. ADAK18 TaxID=2730848 RepID=UPI00146405DE|nr:hypothetical protein [Pseudomonas sp. ADAK18]QJI29861.1 hypothetical protein HKK55_14465 [Pseudomonas sp. ADAK18]
MKSVKIITIKNNARGSVTIEYEGGKPNLTLLLDNGRKRTYTACDLYDCLGILRADFKDTKFLCKGAKINVHTSGMSSQMSNGLVAYELKIGQPDGDKVYIFDYDEDDITNNIQEQHDFCMRWAAST